MNIQNVPLYCNLFYFNFLFQGLYNSLRLAWQAWMNDIFRLWIFIFFIFQFFLGWNFSSVGWCCKWLHLMQVHFRGYPGNVLTPCEGEDSVKWSFINSLKEVRFKYLCCSCFFLGNLDFAHFVAQIKIDNSVVSF